MTNLARQINSLTSLLTDAIDPVQELGAYEYLWSETNATFKRLSEQLNNSFNTILPSNYVDDLVSFEYAKKVFDIFKQKDINDFGFRFKGTFDYLDRLKDAVYPVELLYFRGNWEFAEREKSIAVVGSRKVSSEGIHRTYKLVKELVKERYTIFSGLAEGVDTIAHKAAIECGGETVAVIGTPITEYYPKQNKKLQDYIASKFLIISQVPILRYAKQDWRVNRSFFPERNKTMSALTDATIIVEASETSGTLIQARAAISQERKLFILDNCFKNKDITWPQRFEKKGAIRVREISDIIDNMP